MISRKKFKLSQDIKALLVVGFSVVALSYGWYENHHLFKTSYTVKSSKIDDSIKIAMFGDSHIGASFDVQGFSKRMDQIQQENPDILLIVGDFVDDSTSKDMLLGCVKRLAQFKTKYGVFFVMGNHEQRYYGSYPTKFSISELIFQLENHSVKVLEDESVLIANKIYLIGRKDFSTPAEVGGRKQVDELIEGVDKSKYLILMDHRPVEYNEIESKVDLVLSSHTHGGQLFPFNQATKWFGGNKMVYGLEQRGNTKFIVSSGMSNGTMQFKTGTKSEFVLISIEKDR